MQLPFVKRISVHRQAICICLALATLGLATLGCGAKQTPQPPTETNLKAIYVLYGWYTGQHRGKSPPDDAAFKKFIKSLDGEQLKSLTASDPETLFVSPRDNQPYVVHYKTDIGIPGVGTPGVAGGGWLAHETTGVNGKKYILLPTGIIEEVNEQRFAEIVQ